MDRRPGRRLGAASRVECEAGEASCRDMQDELLHLPHRFAPLGGGFERKNSKQPGRSSWTQAASQPHNFAIPALVLVQREGLREAFSSDAS